MPSYTHPLRRIDRPYLGIQYLRALAALMVLMLHAFRFNWFPLGLLGTGVDLFFVLSGFLMVAITDEQSRPGPFLFARLVRIVPLYWLITTVSVLLLWGGVAWDSPIPFRHAASYAEPVPVGLIAASYAFVPWFDPATGLPRPVVSPGWTLNLEMLFYLLVALSLLLPRPRQIAVLAVVIAGLALAGILRLSANPTLMGWMHPVILEFLIGAWIGTAWQRRGNLWQVMLAATLAIALFAVIHQSVGRIGDANSRYIMAIPYGALLILVLQAEDRGEGVPRFSIPLFLGNASYAIYLVQFPVMLILERAGLERGLVFAVSTIALTLGCAAMLYRYFEMPIVRARRQDPAPIPPEPR